VLAQQDRDWPELTNVIGRPELLSDERFSGVRKRSANAGALATILDEAFKSKPLSHWKDVFSKTRITVGVVQTLEEAVHDEQMIANNILVPLQGVDREIRTVNSPMQVIGADKVSPRRAPNVGEHTAEVLLELGFSEEKVEALQANGAAPQGAHAEPPIHVPGRAI
jgi:crotonobetainyl-CoA:carnitine CoA-transferase CaiB-like acyl-CoA transferase